MNNLGLIKWMLLLVCTQLHAQDEHARHSQSMLSISVAFDAQGELWRARVKDNFVVVDVSRDLGRSFSNPININPQPQKIGTDGEARPKIAIGPEGNVYLTWTESLKKPFSGYIWFARSVNHGKTFEKPYIVHQDRAEIPHRLDAINVAPNGNITVSWLDKRDLIAAKVAGKKYDGAAIYYAVSLDHGASFVPEQKLADSSCECCRIAFTNKPDGTNSNSTVVAMWRHVFAEGERDYVIAEIPLNTDKQAAIKRTTFARWKIDGCPHHGVALASGGEGKDWWGYHMAWFDGGNDDTGKKSSLLYARMDGVAWVSSPAKKFGNQKKQASHPALLSLGENVWLVWRETEAKNNSIMLLFSADGGRSWSDAKVIASTTNQADYPLLIAKDKQPYLAWNTLKDGFLQLKL